MKVNRKYLKESLNEDLFDRPRDIADSICKYLDSKNFYNYELVDYDSYPMNTIKITFEVDGDWKHDHLYFKDLVFDWSFDNNKSIYKIESELVRDDGSDDYASNYFIYVTENEDSLKELKSMSKLFSEEYEEDVDNWQSLDKDKFLKRFKKYPEFTEIKVDIYTDPPYYTFDDAKKEAEKYNVDIPVYYKENSSGILRGAKSDIIKYLSSMITMDEIKDDYPELFESLKEASYGGAFDIEDDQFFTRDDINEFAWDVADSLSSEFGKTFDVADSYMETPKRLHLEVTDGDYDYSADIDINMRRIRSPRDLYKYIEEAINQIKGQF